MISLEHQSLCAALVDISADTIRHGATVNKYIEIVLEMISIGPVVQRKLING